MCGQGNMPHSFHMLSFKVSSASLDKARSDIIILKVKLGSNKALVQHQLIRTDVNTDWVLIDYMYL